MALSSDERHTQERVTDLDGRLIVVGPDGDPISGGGGGGLTDAELRASDVEVNDSSANTSLTAIKTAVEILDNVVSGSEAQVDVVAPLPAGTNAIGKLAANSGVDIGDVDVTSLTSADLGTGATPSVTISAASTNATSVKGSAGRVLGAFVSNINAAARYLKLYNKATAPTVGTDTPVAVFLIPGNTEGRGFVLPISNPGIAFGTGIGFALTTGVANSDTGAVAANELVVNLFYK